jgi:hypothetical protein
MFAVLTRAGHRRKAKTMGNSSALLSTEIRNSDRIAGKPVVTVVTSQLHSSAFPEGI